MKVVILAGGFGTRISEESHLKPKPMIEIGGYPILWHIMKYYTSFGFNEFVICAGYKQQVIKEYFANYYLHHADITFDFSSGGEVIVHDETSEPGKVTVVDTGLNTMTGGRIKRIQPYVDNEAFMLTYGDGVSNVNLDALLAAHRSHGTIATITAVGVTQRFGVLDIDKNGLISSFREKKDTDGALINGGYMVLDPGVFDYIEGDQTVFEQGPLESLAAENQLSAYVHDGFWQCMDTQRDKMNLEALWQNRKAPWRVW